LLPTTSALLLKTPPNSGRRFYLSWGVGAQSVACEGAADQLSALDRNSCHRNSGHFSEPNTISRIPCDD